MDFLNQNKSKRVKLKQFHQAKYEIILEDDNNPDLVGLHAAIRSLSKNQQIVLRLFYTQEYSLMEISEILDISIGTVKSRLFHSREKLKTILK